MLQRSPTYIVSRPTDDALAKSLRRYLPTGIAYSIARWYYVLFGLYFFNLSRRKPDAVKQWIVSQAQAQLGADYDVKTHFTPRYNPWDQRLCLAPDADFFKAIKAGKADVVTDQITTFTETGIRLQSGRELTADIVVTATGLKLQLLGGIQILVDGRPVMLGETMNFKGVMFSDVPNSVRSVRLHQCLLDAQERSDRGLRRPADQLHGPPRLCGVHAAPARRIGGTRAFDRLLFGLYPARPRSASAPRLKKAVAAYQNYVWDLLSLRFGSVNDGALEFSRRGEASKKAA